jgi:PAS domain-containing protein
MGGQPGAFDRVDWLNLTFFAATCGLIVWAVRRAVWARKQTVRLGSELAESQARFRHLADNMPQLTWMARPNGHIFWYNRRWFEYTGTTFEEMEGWGWQKVHDPDLLPSVMDSWKHAVAVHEPWEHTFPRPARRVYRWFPRARCHFAMSAGRSLWFGPTPTYRTTRTRRGTLPSARTRAPRA